ncbi:ABC-type nitrate/sulfonate/bicarbonate transport system, permease component [Candidatus Nitrososphaera evergladensis SR1]|uniref:ABC-type nitrate/sulfonate/bicarbonate transport system, permease component n=1 Tax=Candidatus Nitrososphaera evergladensis SR1 TaxID=1459636 RepID=A0A075N106_9ARCH|nr:ABC transporter permease [Candidatus Nitrososphaera evergladensis]AIF85164.1 ABC-type nitrate/sulfonate/bicarbonate transport system, permease component [Candidatus Nitrososphaera evergladensis SR1]
MQKETTIHKKVSSNSAKKNSRFDATDAANAFLFIAAFIGVWQLAFSLGIWPKVLMPSPAMVAQTIVGLVADSSLTIGIGVTMWRLFAGFVISVGIGGAVGLAMVKFPSFGKTLSSFAVGLLTFPSIAWVPFSILLISFNDFGILFVLVMASVFSVMISTYSSIRNIPPIYIRAAKNMGASGFSLFRYVMIPAATPSLIIGLRQAWSFAWHALIGAEILITTLYGLGHILQIGREFQDMGQIIAVMIAVFAIGLLFDRLVFVKLEEKVRARWGLDQHSQ